MDPPDWKKNQDSDQHDPMMSHVQKSIIASIVSDARKATLNQPTRPETPGDLPRHLFSGNDYSERPGSAYKVGQVANDAIENFTRSSTAETNEKSRQNNSKISLKPRPNSRSRGTKLEPIVRTNKEGAKKVNKISIKKGLPGPGIAPKSLNTFKGNKPIKVTMPSNQSFEVPSELNLNDCEIGKANMFKNQQDALKQQTELMESMQKARCDYDNYVEAPDDDDDMENYFIESMSKELESNLPDQAEDQYTEALERLEEIKRNQADVEAEISNIKNRVSEDGEIEDDLEARLMDDITQSMKVEANEESKSSDTKSDFEKEYEKLIQEFSLAINSKNRKVVGLTKITEVSNRVVELIDSWRDQDPDSIKKCYKETMLKGALSLIENTNPISVFRISKCCIHVINSIYNEKCRLSEADRVNDDSFLKLFSSLLSVVKIIFKYSKGKEYDKLFESEKIYDDMLNIIIMYYIDGRSILDQLTKKVIKKVDAQNVEIKNTNATFDLLIYIVGLIKNSSINKENQNVLHNKNAIHTLTKLCKTVLNEEEVSNTKIPQLFVQVTGCFRNLAVNPQQVEIFIQEGALVALSQIMSHFKEHKELSFNIVRILSKISLNYEALDVMNLFGNEFIDSLSEIMLNNITSNAILIRAAFVLGNLTTVYADSRQKLLKDGSFFTSLLKVSDTLFQNDIQAKKQAKDNKKLDFNQGNTEDALTKIIRLIANLLTETNCKKLIEINTAKVDKFFKNSMKALSRKNLKDNEECILNIVACFTNFLFYDTNDFSIFTEEHGEKLRQTCIKFMGKYLLESDNDELRVETMRVLCNLSRNKECCELLVNVETLLNAISDLLTCEIRDLKFYNIGLLINICLNPKGRKIVVNSSLTKIIDVLKDSNIEDMDMSKVACKAIISFCEEKQRWDNESIQTTDDICSEIGEELDSIMDVANESEKEILMQLRYLINQVINNLPEIMYSCDVDNCGRKFKTKDELGQHQQRRHNM